MPPKTPMLTLEEKTNLHLRWFIGPNKNICTVIPNTDDEYEDLGEIETGTHLQRMTFGDKLMDLVLFRVVGGREFTLSWKMAQFHTTEAHMKFGKWSNPSNLAKDFGNDFLIFDLSLDCDNDNLFDSIFSSCLFPFFL